MWRQSWHEAKGRKESLERRVACDPHVDLRRERSWEVKKASDVLRLPEVEISMHHRALRYLTYYEPLRAERDYFAQWRVSMLTAR